MDSLKDKLILKLGEFNLSWMGLVITIVLIVFTFSITRVIRFLVFKYGNKHNKDIGRLNSFVMLITYSIWIVAIIVVLKQLDVHFAYLVGGSAALLVGIGLSLQDIFKDFMAGLVILFEGKARKGDVLEINGIIGSVDTIGLRTTELIRRDGVKLIIPNNKLISENTVNWSHTKKPARHSVFVYADYDSEPYIVEEILRKCLIDLKEIEREGVFAPYVRLIDLSPIGYQFELLIWTYEYFRFENIKSNLRFLIVDSFRKNNIRIPRTQRTTLTSSDSS